MMDKFWKWMEEQGYAQRVDIDDYVIYGNYKSIAPVNPTEQMLYGYKKEYLAKHKAPKGQAGCLMSCWVAEIDKEIEEIK